MRWLKYLLIGILTLVLIGTVGVRTVQHVSDGPLGPLQGGPFTTGKLLDATITDFSLLEDEPTELLLVGPGTSRTLGIIMRDGVVYISCDLGFMWNRLEGRNKQILRLIYTFKDWHQRAVEDGRAELRIAGNRYAGQLTRVENPELLAALKAQLEVLAAGYFAPAELGPVPSPPNDIWFFRFDPTVHGAGKT